MEQGATRGWGDREGRKGFPKEVMFQGSFRG